MLSDADRKKAADILINAEKARKQAVQLSTTWPDIQIEDSYAISTRGLQKLACGIFAPSAIIMSSSRWP